jgi:hypothetical protein
LKKKCKNTINLRCVCPKILVANLNILPNLTNNNNVPKLKGDDNLIKYLLFYFKQLNKNIECKQVRSYGITRDRAR